MCPSDLPTLDHMLTTKQEKGPRDQGRTENRRVGSSMGGATHAPSTRVCPTGGSLLAPSVCSPNTGFDLMTLR